ncbi:DUF951 domain-containing protein [Periweissella beninensis]|uniref:DUF951 domain-containing protein n=1 Tax=Periweissella beninensis TaxID=504936 RepID=A0ABT0VIL2_9LACO|nr:DUF951 domain-containing protein [Periweissella beninensis]MBM7543940.1 hypothetical protein [Periweissella beninensis]MCM2437666.1 DUF951 domain-containing protein [Periweissella beninensis]
MDYQISDIVEMKKAHACGTNAWKILRIGADIKLKCEGCGHMIMLTRLNFNHRIKRVISSAAEPTK